MVLTTVPQTALPVLAAEEEAIEATAETTPDVEEAEENETSEDADESTEPEEVEESADGEDPEDDDTTDDEQIPEEGDASEETPEDNDTPVIDPTEDVEEPVSGEQEESVQDTDASVMGDEAPVATEFAVTDVTENKEGYEIDLGEGKVTGEADFTFTVTPKANYKVKGAKYTVGDDATEKEPTAGNPDENGAVTYTITKENLTADIGIKVTMEKKKYTITVNKTDGDSVLEVTTTPETEIDAGETLTFTAKVKDANKDTHKITELSYQVDGDEAVTPETSANGTYTIPNVSGDVVIAVTAEKIPTYAVTFTKNEKIAKVTDIKINDEAAAKPELGADDSEWKISDVKEGSSVSFKLAPAAFFKVAKVTDASSEELKPDTTGTYTISSLEADATLTMTADLDETQCYAFTFAMADGSDPASATVEVSMPVGATDMDNIAGSKNDGDKTVSRNEKVVLTFKAATGYEINDESIKAVGATLTKVEEPAGNAMVATSAKYELTMTKGTPATVTVGTDAIGTEKENTVEIKLGEEVKHLTLGGVKVDGTAVTETEGKYVVAKAAKRVSFVINAAGAFAPKVTNAAGTQIDADKEEKTGDTTAYTYTVLANALPDGGETFTVTEKAVTQSLTLAGDTDNVNTVVSVNGKVLAKDKFKEIAQGQTVTVKVTQKTNCALTAVSYTVDETAGPAVKVTKGAAEFNVKMTGDVEITVTARGLYKAGSLYDKNGKEVAPVKNIYNVSYDELYRAGIVQGAEERAVKISRAELLDGTRAVVPAEGKEVVTINVAEAAIDLANATGVAGKKLTLKLYAKEGEGEDAEEVLGATYTLQLSKVISSISAPNSVNQTTDTVKGYKVTTNGEVSRLIVYVKDETKEDVIVDVPKFDEETGLLMIQTGQDAGTAEVVISDGADVSKTIKVTSKALISSTTAKPSVKLKSASDIDLTLTLGAKNIDTPEKGAVLYEVKVTPQTGEGKPANLLDAVATQYIVKDGAAQDVTIKVVKDKVTGNDGERDATYGDGGAWKYDVEVALVHVKDKSTTVTEANINDNLLAEARSIKFTTGTRPFATQTPAWEVNLKLKKGTTTVYTGQTAAMIATPQFTKTTTYTEIASKDIIDITHTGGAALQDLKIENGQIYASATNQTAVGKHTVQVTAKAADSMYASRATVVVTVVRGIDTLGVTVPSTSVYKPVKKAAILKAAAYYNDDKTGKNKTVAPKTKKVTWEIVKNAQGEEFASTDPLYGMVTVKNGTVTVNKDYVVAADEADNQFVIKATVDNGPNGSKFIGKAEAAYSDVISITNVGADLSTVAIVKPVYKDNTPAPPEGGGNSEGETPSARESVLEGYKVVAVANGKNAVDVEASAITGGLVKAFTAESDVAKDKEYTEDELAKATVPDSDVSYKSNSAKNVAVSATGKISVVKPAKAKLTVTANDGSKAKAEISLNVIFDSTKDKTLALKISKAVPSENGTWTADAKALVDPANPVTGTVEYNGSAVSRLVAEVMVSKEAGGYEAAPDYANFDIKITSGKKTQQEGNKAYLTSDKQEFKITLTDKSISPAKPVEYVFKNKDVLGSSSTKIGAKALNTLHPVGTKEEQKVKIELSKIPDTLVTSATTDGGKLAAAVEVDWNKLSDKNRADLTAFATGLSAETYEIEDYNADTKKGTIELSFNSNAPKFNQSSYALKVTVGSQKGNDFTASTVPAAATVKVDKVKKFTFKPTTSYTIGLKDAGAVLTGKSSIPVDDLNLEFTKLLNANIKGVENEFTSKFEIDESKGMIVIKSGVDTEALAKDKDNLTGYLVYSATTDKDYYDNKGVTGQIVKITVKIKDAASVKYGISETLTIENRVGASTQPFSIMAGDKEVEIAGNFMVVTNNVWIQPGMENGKITLTLMKELGKNKTSFPATIYFSPKGSQYESIFYNDGKVMTDEQWEEHINKAASVKVTVKVTPVMPKDMTVEEVKTAVEAWAKGINDATNKPDWLTSDNRTEDILESDLLSKVKRAVNATDAVTYAINVDNDKKQIEYVKAEAGTAGYLKATIKITKGEDSATVEINLTIPAKQGGEPVQPEEKEITEALKTAISEAVKSAATGESKTITIKTDSTWDSVSAAVLAAANGTSGVSPDFEVVGADSEPLTIENNKATIKLVVRQKNLTTNKAEITIGDIAVTEEQQTEPET